MLIWSFILKKWIKVNIRSISISMYENELHNDTELIYMCSPTCALSHLEPAGFFVLYSSILLSAGLSAAMKESKCCRVQRKREWEGRISQSKCIYSVLIYHLSLWIQKILQLFYWASAEKGSGVCDHTELHYIYSENVLDLSELWRRFSKGLEGAELFMKYFFSSGACASGLLCVPRVHVLLTLIVLCWGETLYIVQTSLRTPRCVPMRRLKCKSHSST